jgi:predicted nuclease of predicted toxin-antitoxin system
MVHKLHKHKLLLDENMPNRVKLPRLNGIFDVKHIRDDMKFAGIKDSVVYDQAKKTKRILITFNGDDFKKLVLKADSIGVISVPATMPEDQIDKKLTSLFIKSTENTFKGKFIPLAVS